MTRLKLWRRRFSPARLGLGVLMVLCATLSAAVAAAEVTPSCADVFPPPDYQALYGPVDYEADRPDCTISWVGNNRLVGITWTAATDDDEVDLKYVPDSGYVLSSSRPPQLIDIDQDGWPDLGVFTLIGMVNGDYTFFRFDPATDGFIPFGVMNGAYFVADDHGHIIAVGRSSAAASGIDVFNITDVGLEPEFSMYVDAGLQTGIDGAAECRVAIEAATYVNPDKRAGAALYPQAPDLIATLCAYYEEGAWDFAPLADIENDTVLVPAQTVFHCQLEGGTHAVTVTRDAAGFHYAYGPLGGERELRMTRSVADTHVLPENGAGPSRFGEITLRNGDYAYTVYYGFELFDDNGDLHVSTDPNSPYPNDTFVRGLVVKRGDEGERVFDKSCILSTSYDGIRRLARR